MEITAADGSAGNANDGVVWVDDLWVSYFMHFDGLLAHPTNSLHCALLASSVVGNRISL